MSIAGAPLQLASGQGVQLTPPQTGVQLAAVVLSNESPYRLTVTTGATAYSQPPFTAQLYRLDLTNQNIGVLPQLPDGATAPDGSSTDLVPTWYQNDEVPTGVYPISLTAQAIAAAIAGSVTTTFEGELLHSGNLDRGAAVTADVGKWASMQIRATDPTGGLISVVWYADAALTILLGQDYVNLAAPNVALVRNLIVRGPYVQISAAFNLAQLQVYATNRSAPDVFVGTLPVDDFQWSGTTVSGQTYVLTSQMSGLQSYYSNGGPVSMRQVVTAGSGRFGWRIVNPANPAVAFDVRPYPPIPETTGGPTEAYVQGVAPAGLLVPIFECALGAAGAVLDLQIVAQS